MNQLTGAQKKYLRGLAHNLNPSAFVGKKGITASLMEEIDQGLSGSELIKIKFIDHKDLKKELIQEIETKAKATCVGMIGHVGILFRRNLDPEKQQITLPKKN